MQLWFWLKSNILDSLYKLCFFVILCLLCICNIVWYIICRSWRYEMNLLSTYPDTYIFKSYWNKPRNNPTPCSLKMHLTSFLPIVTRQNLPYSTLTHHSSAYLPFHANGIIHQTTYPVTLPSFIVTPASTILASICISVYIDMLYQLTTL